MENIKEQVMRKINIKMKDVLGTDFFHYCYYNNVILRYDGYEVIIITIYEEFENEILKRITDKDWT